MPGAPPVDRDVMVVFDRSGSMAADSGAGDGNTKMDEAHEDASLFVELIRSGTGSRVGLLSFSTGASSPVDFALADVTDPNKTALTGVIAGLAPGGTTTIGGGLEAAHSQFPSPGANPRAILLLTDGLQNTPPMIDDVAGMLNGIDVHAIGYGTEANLDGALLAALAESHNGLYTRAGAPLELKKFFALAFGNIFESGTLTDPPATLKPGQAQGTPTTFHVYDEDTVTIVVGWDREGADLEFELKAPSGAVIPLTDPGIEDKAGSTWRFARVPLPQNGEREGTWTVIVGRGELPRGEVAAADRGEVNYFVSVIASGGPRLRKLNAPTSYFTGDPINPLVGLAYLEGGWPPNITVQLTVTRPSESLGNIIARHGLDAPTTIGGDTIPARQATIAAIAQQQGSPAVQYHDITYTLSDSPANTQTFEKAGVFGAQIADLLTAEGHYTFHFRATYGDTYEATRELTWSTYVDTSVDPSQSTVTTTLGPPGPGGTPVTIVIDPRDKYGNRLGPGRSGSITVTGGPCTTVSGSVQDDGDGTYTVAGTWDPSCGQPPSIVITQPGRPPVIVTGSTAGHGGSGGHRCHDDDCRCHHHKHKHHRKPDCDKPHHEHHHHGCDDENETPFWKGLTLGLAIALLLQLIRPSRRDDD
jgi:von Willebrand factor type A domain